MVLQIGLFCNMALRLADSVNSPDNDQNTIQKKQCQMRCRKKQQNIVKINLKEYNVKLKIKSWIWSQICHSELRSAKRCSLIAVLNLQEFIAFKVDGISLYRMEELYVKDLANCTVLCCGIVIKSLFLKFLSCTSLLKLIFFE